MTTLTLYSAQERSLRPLVESALEAERRLLDVAIRQTEAHLREFEVEHEMSTAEFLQRFANDEFTETLELDEWIGESRLLERLREKAETLKGIRFAD